MKKQHFGGRVRDGIGRTTALAALLAAMPVAAAGVLPAQTTAKSSGMMSGHPSADSSQALVSLLVTANRDEVAAGRLAVSKAKRADVKAFGQRMVDEHGAALAKLTDGSKSGGWMIPDSTAMSGMVGSSDMSRMNGKRDSSNMKGSGMARGADTTMQMGMSNGMTADASSVHAANLADMKKLNAASGDSFDNLYLSTQTKGHQGLLDKLSRYNTSNAALQSTVSSMKAAIQQHLDALHKLQQQQPAAKGTGAKL